MLRPSSWIAHSLMVSCCHLSRREELSLHPAQHNACPPSRQAISLATGVT